MSERADQLSNWQHGSMVGKNANDDLCWAGGEKHQKSGFFWVSEWEQGLTGETHLGTFWDDELGSYRSVHFSKFFKNLHLKV